MLWCWPGNALGAYQAGVFQALTERGIEPDCRIGTSVGAINETIIAGNMPQQRLLRLTHPWRPASTDGGWPDWTAAFPETWRRTAEAPGTLAGGRPGVRPCRHRTDCGSSTTPALYDTAPLATTLARLVDFTRSNSGAMRYAALAVDLETGDDAVFDTQNGTFAA
ncbi:hypothetical protein F1C10_14455 [Sphingomonas sp. NBWT7]|uniref:patatin-like phospholipase family protein n=1 Tax=Sphingomonas sp. NBWT7 TaxID=2596913 RepID=UPI00162AAE17|nr:patatin-like phospholipase family protein [Sphingomonas sp. NBWT7]QNE33001.1 hypothetical protein F1C10_14455 [Sphingomonas sp. NBWT7]